VNAELVLLREDGGRAGRVDNGSRAGCRPRGGQPSPSARPAAPANGQRRHGAHNEVPDSTRMRFRLMWTAGMPLQPIWWFTSGRRPKGGTCAQRACCTVAMSSASSRSFSHNILCQPSKQYISSTYIIAVHTNAN